MNPHGSRTERQRHAGRQQELLDGTFRTTSAFRGYGSQDFRSATELAGRDALLLQGSLRLHHTSNFFTQIEAGASFSARMPPQSTPV